MPLTPSPNASELDQKQSHISVERFFEVSLLLMLGTSFVMVASTGKLDLISVIIVSLALLFKLWGYAKDRKLQLGPRTVTRLGVFYIFFFVLDFLIFAAGPSLLDNLLTATVHLILFATVIKVFSACTYRDYGYLAALSFLTVLASAILTVGTPYLVLFILYVLFAIATFISYEIKRSMEASERAPRGPYAAPALNRRALENSLARATVGLAAGIVALASVLFFVIPRYRTRYLIGLATHFQNITGFSESVQLGDLGRILRSSAVVMRVIPEGSPREFQSVKWRGIALTSFDGRHWYNDNTDLSLLPPAGFRRFVLPRVEGLQYRPPRLLRYRVLLSSLSTNVLFAASVPREINSNLQSLALDETHSLHNPQHSFSPIQYEAVSQAGLPSADALRRASTEYPAAIRLVYLQLPHRLDPQVAALAKQVTASAQNNYDRAVSLRNYLRNNFSYTLNPPHIEPADPIGSFLFKAKEGYCEYFAAAMAVMLRTLGIPARLVNGFQTGTYNRLGHDFIVRERDAHSWVEVYFTNFGWIPFDPTPPDPNPVISSVWDDYVDAVGLFWNEWIINYDFAHQVQLARAVEQNSRQLRSSLRDRLDRVRRRAIQGAYRVESFLMAHKLLTLFLMLAAMAGMIVMERGFSRAELRFLWAWTFRQNDRAPDSLEASMIYQRFLGTLRRKGLRKPPAQTPLEFAAELKSFPFGPPAQEFTRIYNALRFGHHHVPMGQLRNLLDQIRHSRGSPASTRR